MTVRVRAAVNVGHAGYIDRPHWGFNDLLLEGRGLIVAIGDLLLMFSEPAARWLLAMLAPLVPPASEAIGRLGLATAWACETPAGHDTRVRIQVAVHRPSEVGRPRWEHGELVVSVGGVVVVFSEPAARRLLEVLTVALAAEVSHGVEEA